VPNAQKKVGLQQQHIALSAWRQRAENDIGISAE
jgi:hypothetical protein